MKRLLGSKTVSIQEKNKEEDKHDTDIDIIMLEEYLENREKNIFSILPEDFTLLKTTFDKFKIPYLNAPDEAEALCNYLVINGLADATFSLDSDCIAYKVPILINDLNTVTGICKVITYSKLCEELELTPEELTLFCCILGTDYNRHTKMVKGVGPVTAIKMIKKWKTYEALKINEKKFQLEEDGLRYSKCLELFNLSYPQFTAVPIWDNNIDVDDIVNFLYSNQLYCDKDKLISLWKPPKIIFTE
jgi:5'-3' exonuclease